MRWVVGLGVIALIAASLCAEEIDPAKLKRDFAGSVVALRQPLRGSEITFQADGNPVPPIQRGTFGRDALFRIDDLKLDGRSLQLMCHRVILLARSDKQGIEFFPTDEKTRIVVVLASRDADRARAVLDGIFRRNVETEGLLTNYARAFTREGVLEPDRPVFACKAQPINRPAPYGAAGGRMVAKVIVNERGEPEAIGILSAPEKKGDTTIFIETLWNWRFAPYLKNGKPSSCSATVGMRFVNRMRPFLR
jgi:hypothetical protein